MKHTLLAAAALVALSPVAAWAAPVQWTTASGGNGHWYEFVAFTSAGSWAQARAGALSRTHLGMGGHLATVTSAGENDFLTGRSTARAYLGGSDAAVEGVWRWVDGPEAGQAFAHTNWMGGEPNNWTGEDAAGEDYLMTNYSGPLWVDIPNASGIAPASGYFVEYSPAAPTGVPLPGALGLLGLALAGLAAARRAATG